MAEYINRDLVLKSLSCNSITKKITLFDDVSIYDSIKALPTIDVDEDVNSRFTVIIQFIDGRTIKIKDVFAYGYEPDIKCFCVRENEFTHFFNREQVCCIGRETNYR